MQNRLLLILNGVVALATAVFLFTTLAPPESSPAAPRIEQIPGPAAFTRPDKELAFVVFPEPDAETGADDVTFFAQPLQADGRVDATKPPRQLLKQPDPPGCMTDSLHPAPNGRFLLIQYNCESTLFARLLDVSGQAVLPAALPVGYFLDWSPEGDYLLFRDMDADQVLLLAADRLSSEGVARQVLNLPEGTYSAVFAPDGATLHYAATEGLGFGTERGLFDLAKDERALVEEFPRETVGTPRWSPDGAQLATIRMPDSNIPFTVGELWLVSKNGRDTTRLGEADAGHGYAPVWSPDGQSVVFVQRENSTSSLADYAAHALHSNLYLADIKSGAVTALTTFKESLVNAPAFSADGQRLAFAADDAVWTVEMAGGVPVRISPADSRARLPVWLPNPDQ